MSDDRRAELVARYEQLVADLAEHWRADVVAGDLIRDGEVIVCVSITPEWWQDFRRLLTEVRNEGVVP